jgi:hypothetical protein
MTIGIALVLIFVLYLIDKHNRWRQAAKIVIGLVVLALLAVGGTIGWEKYDAYRTKKRTEAETAAYQARVKTCVAKSTPAGNETAAQEQLAACTQNPDAPVIIDFSKAEPIPGFIPDVPKGYTLVVPPKVHVQVRHVRVKYDTDITTTEISNLTCGHVREGETATLLEEGTIGVKIRTATGDVGWAFASAFEIAK